MKKILVSVGILQNDAQYLIALRQDGKELSGYWEFPGGKQEAGESPLDALTRELKEEINIIVEHATLFKEFSWVYNDKEIHLTFFHVHSYKGQPHANESQKIKWVYPEELRTYKFPEANRYAINLLTLPNSIVITPDCNEMNTWMQRVKMHLANQNTILRLRFSNRLAPTSQQLSEIVELSAQSKSYVMFDPNDFEYIIPTPYTGIHLNRHQTMRFMRSDNHELILGASVHNEDELEKALRLGVDYVMISPVLPTQTHPDAEGIGWQRFSNIIGNTKILCYALGGMTPSMMEIAQDNNAHGIAGLRGFW